MSEVIPSREATVEAAGTRSRLTMEVASWVHRLAVEQLPAEVVEQVKSCLLDALSCAGSAAQRPDMRALTAALQLPDAGGPGRTWFLGGATSPWTEAFVNGTLIHALDYDDSHKRSKTHPGAPVLPAALAAGRFAGADLADVIAGIVAGYEVVMRLGAAVGPAAHRRQGWHATATCGAVGAAAAAARVLRLEPGAIASAIGHGATQAAGLWAFTNDGAMSKRIHPGNAARAGLTGAVLARAGITGSRVALEASDGGFFAAFAPAISSEVWAGLVRRIGDPFWLPEVAVKPYPCCRTAHTAIDAVLALRAAGLTAADVECIEVRTYRLAVEQCGFNNPGNEVRAAFSTPYLVARALTDGDVDVSHFTAQQVADPDVDRLQRRVRVVPDPELDTLFPAVWPAHLIVTTRSGVVREKRVDVALGDPAVGMSAAQRTRKFLAGAEPHIGPAAAAELSQKVLSLPLSGPADLLWAALDLTSPKRPGRPA